MDEMLAESRVRPRESSSFTIPGLGKQGNGEVAPGETGLEDQIAEQSALIDQLTQELDEVSFKAHLPRIYKSHMPLGQDPRGQRRRCYHSHPTVR